MPSFSAYAVLDPKGVVAISEKALMIHAVEFMLIVIIPVYLLLFFFAWWFRASNTKATYMPKWEHSKMEELVWWAIPFEIVLVLGALTWGSTHQLDPRAPLNASAPLVIEVVALDWKWLFIYPNERIASVNYVRFPVDMPVQFKITADAPMNSFWIPQLGGQIYAMTGMVNSLNLMANTTGTYAGGSANYSGSGFAQMKFIAEATSQADFNSWVASLKSASSTLTLAEYRALAEPDVSKPRSYSDVLPKLYDTIVMKFMDQNSTEMRMQH